MAVADLVLPGATDRRHGYHGHDRDRSSEQRAQYTDSLVALRFLEVQTFKLKRDLAFAYNFASDATGYLNLIVSICDLRPLVLWGTIAEHLTLSEAFRGLPGLAHETSPPSRITSIRLQMHGTARSITSFHSGRRSTCNFPLAHCRGRSCESFQKRKEEKHDLTYRDKAIGRSSGGVHSSS